MLHFRCCSDEIKKEKQEIEFSGAFDSAFFGAFQMRFTPKLNMLSTLKDLPFVGQSVSHECLGRVFNLPLTGQGGGGRKTPPSVFDRE